MQREEIEVYPTSTLIGKTIAQSDIGRDIGVIILGIKRADVRVKFNPTSQTLIKEGDTLIVIEQTERLMLLEKTAKG
ncbi:MAG: TrkA C-terminal domain-containing protein [Thermodesulfovibrio sp.]|nr:TrkA C-terminal domain-containing protein [Thermodesulfovibrio sp.]